MSRTLSGVLVNIIITMEAETKELLRVEKVKNIKNLNLKNKYYALKQAKYSTRHKTLLI